MPSSARFESCYTHAFSILLSAFATIVWPAVTACTFLATFWPGAFAGAIPARALDWTRRSIAIKNRGGVTVKRNSKEGVGGRRSTPLNVSRVLVKP